MNKLRFFIANLLLLLPAILFAQMKVSGTVNDQSGMPIPGVNVKVIGTTQGTVTDFDGNYSIENVKKGSLLEFSYVGYKTQQLNATAGTLNVTMAEDAQALQEVVVIGYGTTTKKDATGSLESVSAKDFNKGAIVSADQLLAGKVAGVRITSNGGQPDSAPNIRIRGGASLSANNNPLIVIDGIPIDNSNPAGISNPLSLVNPNDIESFSVLKDASATAIYGSRASNGVIIITTKKGASSGVKFNFSSDVSIGSVSKKIDMMNGKEFVKFMYQFHNDPDLINKLGVDDPTTSVTDNPNTTDVVEGRIIHNTNWQDAVYRNSINYNNNFSAMANVANIPMRFSIGNNHSEGLVKTNDFDRLSLSLKATPKFLNDHLKVDINAKGLYSDKNAIDDGGALGNAIRMDPTKPIYDSASIFGGYFNGTRTEGGVIKRDGNYNPLALLMQRDRPEQVYKFLGNVEFDYKFHWLPELRGVLNLGLEKSKAEIREIYGENALSSYSDNAGIFNPGLNYKENQDIENKTLDAYAIYAKSLKGILSSFDIQAGYSYQNFENEGTKEEYKYNETTGLRELIYDSFNPTNLYYNALNLQSFFGRSNLNLADKYLFTFSFRADGSSLFNKNNRWGYFPAVALAWKISDESFIKGSKVIDNLKLRLGYGLTGQQDITGLSGFYPSIPLFEAGSSTSQYLSGVNLYSAKAFNPDLTWEKTATANVGLDFSLFNNGLISGNFDVYQRNTKDLLAFVPTPPGQALTSDFVSNVGETESKGFELNLDLKAINTDKANLSFNYNLAYNKTKVTSLKDTEYIKAAESNAGVETGVVIAYHYVGHEVYSANLYKQVYDTDGNPIPGAVLDLNGDNKITEEDKYLIPLRPNWTYGFGINFGYNNWDFSSNFRGQMGGHVYNSRRVQSGYTNVALPVNSSSLTNVLDFYNDAADIEFLQKEGRMYFSDHFLEDASFLRCENMVLGYTFKEVLKNTNVKLYGAVNNAFIITKYSGQDPENFNSIDNNFYPRPRVITMGVNFDF